MDLEGGRKHRKCCNVAGLKEQCVVLGRTFLIRRMMIFLRTTLLFFFFFFYFVSMWQTVRTACLFGYRKMFEFVKLLIRVVNMKIQSLNVLS